MFFYRSGSGFIFIPRLSIFLLFSYFFTSFDFIMAKGKIYIYSTFFDDGFFLTFLFVASATLGFFCGLNDVKSVTYYSEGRGFINDNSNKYAKNPLLAMVNVTGTLPTEQRFIIRSLIVLGFPDFLIHFFINNILTEKDKGYLLKSLEPVYINENLYNLRNIDSTYIKNISEQLELDNNQSKKLSDLFARPHLIGSNNMQK